MVWVLYVLALGTTKSNCLYEDDKGELDVTRSQDGELMDGKEYFVIYICKIVYRTVLLRCELVNLSKGINIWFQFLSVSICSMHH